MPKHMRYPGGDPENGPAEEVKYCPFCGALSLRYIEDCEADRDVRKTSWTCDCHDFVLYIYDFSEREVSNAKNKRG